MPARRTSQPSSSRNVRASITAATRPSPCVSNAHPAEPAGAAAATSTKLHVDIAARMRAGVWVMTLRYVWINYCMLTIRHDEGEAGGSRRHCAHFSDRVDFGTLPAG